MHSWAPDRPQKQAMGKADQRGVDSEIAINCYPMDGPIDWWWKMNLLDVCVQAGFCQIRSHISITGSSQGRRRQPKFEGAKYATRIYLYGENYNPME